MVYEDFLNTMKEMTAAGLGPEVTVTLRRVLKNNGRVLDGLTFTRKGAAASPTIYLNRWYEEAENGMPLSAIAERIRQIYRENPGLPEEISGLLNHFPSVREKIVFRLINAEANRDLLRTVPHLPVLDLAMVFCLILSENEQGQMTALVHSEHLALWNTAPEEVICLAVRNTLRRLPARITPIEDALTAMGVTNLPPKDPSCESVTLHVLTNCCSINGAGCLLYPGILKNFAAQQGNRELIILPSSIHEVLLMPKNSVFSYHDLNDMVSFINESEVLPEDRLSDHIYLYHPCDDTLSLPADPSVRISLSESDGILNPQ